MSKSAYTPREIARPAEHRVYGPRPGSAKKRTRSIGVLVAAVATLFAVRLVQVQLLSAPAIAAEALAGRMTTVTVPAHRGQITDRNGVVLATSVDRYTLTGDPKAILNFQGNGRVNQNGHEVANGALGVAQLVAPILNLDEMELAARLNGENRYVVIAKDLEPTVQRKISALNLPAYLHFEQVSKRVYPSGALAGTLLGFLDESQVGQGGIERAFEATLAGQSGTRSFERGANGVPIPGGISYTTDVVDGGDVILTIDADVQWKAQEAADAAVERWGAHHAIVIVQNIATGELWAVADSGGVDPNDRRDGRVADGSRAVQDTFEPGSTGKIITMAAALETGVVTPDSQFIVPFRYETPNGMSFKDALDHPTWQLTATGVLAKSSNTGTVQIAENIPRAVLAEYLDKFRLGQFTGLDLPGESRGKVHPYEQWDGRTRYAVSFGQGLTVNAIQATQVYSIVGNGGEYVAPSLVRGTRAANTDAVVPAQAPNTAEVIQPDTAATLLKMLEQAVADDGTARGARIAGYRVAGKSGTAELIMPTGTTIMASFIGVAPAENPLFTVAVFVTAPQWGTFGGTVAAPGFNDVMNFLLQQQGVPLSTADPNPLPIFWGNAPKN